MNRQKIIDAALTHYGIVSQRIKCIEEMSELTKELCKDAIGDGDKHRIADEIADVLITVRQMIAYYKLDDIVESRVLYKLDRLAHRLELEE